MVRSSHEGQPLGEAERWWIAEQIARYVPLAQDLTTSTSTWARHLITGAFLWYWTADGLDANGLVRRDALKKRSRHVRRSVRAAKAMAKGTATGLIHDHAVPRNILAEELLKMAAPSANMVYDFLTQLCFAVIITDKEDRRLDSCRCRQRMPGGALDRSRPFARYEEAGIELEPMVIPNARRYVVNGISSCPSCSAIVPKGELNDHVAICPSAAAKRNRERPTENARPTSAAKLRTPPRSKKPGSKPKRRSVWTVSGGAFESNRRRH